MRPPKHTAAQQRRLRWRRFVERRTLARRPVSLTRQRIGTGLLVFLAAAFAWYCLVTRDEAIRSRAVVFLEEATSGEVSVGRAQFRMFGGITLYEVHVSVPYDARLDPKAKEPVERTIFSAASVRLVHNPWRLLFGKLHVEEIVATKPTIILSHNVDNGLRNWQLLSADSRVARPAGRGRNRPRITLRSAKLVVVAIDQDGRTRQRAEELDADVRPHPQLPTAYSIEIRRFSPPAERTTVVFDPGERLLTNTPFVDVRTIRLQLPKRLQQFFGRIGLEGEAKLGRLVYDSSSPGGRDTTIELRDVRCAVPLSMLREGLLSHDEGTSKPAAPDQSADLVMTDVRGRLNHRGDSLELDVSGLINGARCSVSGRLREVSDAVEETGLDLHIRGESLPAPEGSTRERILGGGDAPELLRAILLDYDPHGPFDVDLRLTRPPGADAQLQIEGVVQPKGVLASARWFPYPIDDLHGRVRFDGDVVHLEDLHGRHGSADIDVNGRVDIASWWNGADLDFAATAVPLDSALFDALDEHYQAIWRRFGPQGFANITLRIERRSAGEDAPRPDWHTNASVELTDAQVAFTEFPYKLEQVRGVLEIGRDRIDVRGLTGRNAEASARIDGHIVLRADETPEVDLRLEAHDVGLDQTLADALPPEGRGTFAQFQPTGRVDLVGSVTLQDPQQGVVYDLLCMVRDAAITYEAFPYRIDGVHGEIRLRPDTITVVNAEGRHGPAKVSAAGAVRRSADGYVADLEFNCERMTLDQALFDSLPSRLKDVWRLLEPAGSVAARTALHDAPRDGRAFQQHRSEIELTDGRIRLQQFPLPLKEVSAKARVVGEHLSLEMFQGRSSEGCVTARGELDFTPPGYRGAMFVDAVGMTLDEDMLAALPARIGAALRSMEAAGRFDLRLDPLRFEADAEGQVRWDFEGEARLSDARCDLGFRVSGLEGVVRGRGRVLTNHDTDLDLNADLAKVVLAGWPFEDFRVRVVAQPDNRVLRLEDISASLYGGDVSAFAEVDFSKRRPSYQASIAARDLQLSRYLQSQRTEAPALDGSRQALDAADSHRASLAENAAAGGVAGVPPRPAGLSGSRSPRPEDSAVEQQQPEPTAKADGGHRQAPAARSSGSPTLLAQNSGAQGLVFGNMVLRGRAGRDGAREGAGEVFVREAQVWRLPQVLAIFQVLNLTPDERVFHDGWLQFYLSRDTLTFSQIDLQGKAVAFLGGGRMDTRTKQLDLTLLAGSPLRVRVPLLTDILRGAAREIMEIRVTGPLDHPVITPRPLRGLAGVLETLFPEPPGSLREQRPRTSGRDSR